MSSDHLPGQSRTCRAATPSSRGRAAAQGIEPRPSRSERGVLPLHPAASELIQLVDGGAVKREQRLTLTRRAPSADPSADQLRLALLDGFGPSGPGNAGTRDGPTLEQEGAEE